MCGILGFNWRDEELASKLSLSIKHRGPDQDGFYYDKNLSLAHRRLSIVDLSPKGRQPMTTEDGRFSIVFNGEIFNFQELRAEFSAAGYVFKSQSDTEVLLIAYQKYGTDVLKKLNGQFAFAIYDQLENILFLARDRAGINPLYYYLSDGEFIFASELKVILESGIKKEINPSALNYYFLYGHTGRKQTILENCFKLEAGSFLIFDLNKKEIVENKKYWHLEPRPEISDEADAKKLILENLERAVKERMVADVPVGAFLSGGVDSSAVVAIMSRHTKDLNTFSVKFDHDDFDESGFAEIVSKKFGTKHHVISFSAQDVKDLIPELAFHYDEPFADPSMIPTFLVSRVAREKVTVSLSGDGGDELFGGYDSYSLYNSVKKQAKWPVLLNRSIGLACRLSGAFARAGKFFDLAAEDPKIRFAVFRSFIYKSEIKRFLKSEPQKAYREYADSYQKDNYLEEASNIDFHNYLVDDVLTKVDRASLGNSLESRPPLLDHKIMELAFKISSDLKIKDKQTKYIFKKSLEGILPDEIIYRPKKGFSVPLKYYLKNELKSLVKKYVLDYSAHDFYKREYIEDIKHALAADKWKRDYSRPIWAILMFNLWYERWILGKEIEID